MISGSPNGKDTGFIPFKQYTTKIAIIAGGKTFPRYFTELGTSRLPPKSKNAAALVKYVHIETTTIIITE